MNKQTNKTNTITHHQPVPEQWQQHQVSHPPAFITDHNVMRSIKEYPFGVHSMIEATKEKINSIPVKAGTVM